MRTIYKFELENKSTQVIKIPKLVGANSFMDQVLKIDTQYNIPCIWCIVDVEEEVQDIHIRIIGTGRTPHTLLLKENYLGTFMLNNGEYVYHVFTEPVS